MIVSAPVAQGGQELNQDRRKSKFSKIPKKTKGINHLQVLNEIAIKWVDKGYYVDSGKALQALIGGEL